MINVFDPRFVLKQTLATISRKIKFAKLPPILSTNCYFLYQCLVQWGRTSEKRLMIDIMAFWQSYEGKEIYEIWWIYDKDNPADAMTKASPKSALQRINSTNKGRIKLKRCVKQ